MSDSEEEENLSNLSQSLSQALKSQNISTNRPKERNSQQMPPPDADQSTYKPGTIKSISLVNFMCHKSFHLDYGHKVNFSIGPNGSGKSALLTAVVVALGGRATITSRAKKVSEFVKIGCNYARITLVLHNYSKIMDKDQAYKPDEYGKFITVEKTIFIDQAARLALKNEKGKKVSERTQELAEMMEHFGILINNPICILNQEVSKTFLHSKKPEDKFELFMKATNLEQIKEDYNEADKCQQEWAECIDRKTSAFKLMDAEYAACQEKTKFLENRAKLNENRNTINEELLWAFARDNEVIKEGLDKKIQGVDAQIATSLKSIEKFKKKVKVHQDELDLMRSNIQSLHNEQEATDKKLEDIRAREMKTKTARAHLETNTASDKRTVRRLQDDNSNLEVSIADMRKQFKAQDNDQESEFRKMEIDRLEKELHSDNAREKSLRHHTDQLSTSMTNTRADLNSANSRVNTIKGNLSQNNAVLRRLQNGQVSAIRKYGDQVIKIREEIDRAFEQRKFQRKPVGPLGYYVKLKSPDVAPALEVHLNRNAHAFVCDNQRDMTTLQSIIRRLASSRSDFRQPIIITRSFGRRHDTNQFKAVHETYKTLLDYMIVEDDAVFNALVDRCAPESVLFIPEYGDAEALMLNQYAVPRNTRCAYTKDCSVMHPKTSHGGYRSFASNQPLSRYVLFTENNAAQLEEVKREIRILEENLRDAEHVVKGYQDSLNAQRREYDSNTAELKKLVEGIRVKEEKLLNFKTVITGVEPEELLALESELEANKVKIAEKKLSLEQLEEQLVANGSELKDIGKEKEECLRINRARAEQLEAYNKMVEATKKSINESEGMIRSTENVINRRKAELVEYNKEMDDTLDKLARAMRNIPDNCSRPETIRKTEEIREQMRKIDAQLRIEQEEQIDPAELMEILKKRMTEIQNITKLKDSNINNCKLAEKSLNARKEGFSNLLTRTISSVSTTFSSIMRAMDMNGVIQINLNDVVHDGEVVKKAGTLEMSIDTNYSHSSQHVSVMNDANNNGNERSNRRSRSQPVPLPSGPKRARRDGGDLPTSPSEKENGRKNMTDARSLSGGERSFATVAFVLALWHHCPSPFKLMDEIDVFMDMVTRRHSYNALIRFAQCTENSGQFIFFSPLELPKFDNSSSHVRVFEMPVIERNGTQKS